jgi:ribosomal protein S18 acetylase RimI-like enzyme
MRCKKGHSKSPNGNVEIRQMELKDLPAVFRLGQRLFTAEKLPTLYRSWDEHEILELFSSDEETCLVAETEGKIIGFALGCMMEKPRSAWRYGWLEWLAVSPRFKRRGIAARLLNQLTQRFIEREARIMLVDTDEDNADALSFFRRTGFGQELKHVYLSRNLDDHPKSGSRKNGHRNGRIHGAALAVRPKSRVGWIRH